MEAVQNIVGTIIDISKELIIVLERSLGKYRTTYRNLFVITDERKG